MRAVAPTVPGTWTPRCTPPRPGSARTDQTDIAAIAHLLHDDHREAGVWMGSMLRRASHLVEDDSPFWLPVTAVAAGLLRRQVLSIDEISALVHETTECTRR